MKVSEELWKRFLKTSESLWETLKWKKTFILPGGSRQTGMYAPAQFLQTYWASFNPIELLEAAELLEADQRKHEGGQSKETSFSNWLSGVVPRRQCIYCLMCITSSQYGLLQPKTSTKFDGILHNIEKQKNKQVLWQTSPKSKQTHIYGRGQTYNIFFRSELNKSSKLKVNRTP